MDRKRLSERPDGLPLSPKKRFREIREIDNQDLMGEYNDFQNPNNFDEDLEIDNEDVMDEDGDFPDPPNDDNQRFVNPPNDDNQGFVDVLGNQGIQRSIQRDDVLRNSMRTQNNEIVWKDFNPRSF